MILEANKIYTLMPSNYSNFIENIKTDTKYSFEKCSVQGLFIY